MDNTILNYYKSGAKIVEKVLNEVKNLCNIDTKCSHICSYGNELMKNELLGIYKKLDKRIALPVSLSVNSIVSHDYFTENDDYILKQDDLVRIELACSIDGNVSTICDTIKINSDSFLDSEEMVAAKTALTVGIKMIDIDTPISKFQEYIKNVVESFDMHLVERPNVYKEEDTTIYYDWCHRENCKFLIPSWVVTNELQLELQELWELEDEEQFKNEHFTIGEVYHLDVTLAKNSSKSIVSDRESKFFQKTYKNYQIRSKHGRNLINNIKGNTFFWNLNDIDMSETRKRLAIKECLRHDVIRKLGLIEKKNDTVIRLKCSIVVQLNKVMLLTGKHLLTNKSNEKLTDEAKEIFRQSLNFNKRNISV